MEEKKICSRCKDEKILKEFSKNRSTKSGLNNWCKLCQKITKKKYYAENADVIKIKARQWYDENIEKVKEQTKERYLKDKDVILAKNKIWREENKEQFNESIKKWHQNNKEYVQLKTLEYRLKNKDKINENARNRKINDPIHALKCAIRTSISISFSRSCEGKYKKSAFTEEILGCTIDFFINHIRSQYLMWMDDKNYGRCKDNEYNCTWNFDHIIPLEVAKTEEDIIMLNHWSNIQPLCSKQNAEKNDRFYICTNLELGVTFEKSNDFN